MMSHRKIAVILLICTFVGVSFNGVSATETRRDIAKLRFLDTNWNRKLLNIIDVGPFLLTKDVEFEVQKPPKNTSNKTKKELQYLHELAKTERDPETIERIIYEESGVSGHDMFVKEGLIHEQNYKTLMLMEIINNDNMYFILERKKHFARPRPNELDPTLETVIDNPPHAAYPSGHATQTYINALVLSEFDPKHEDEYKQFAIDVAHRREIAGVHYPSDSEAGRKLAVDVLARLRAIPVFEKKFQAAKESYIKPDLSEKK